MKKLALPLVVLLMLLSVLQGAHAAWNASWPKRAKITLDTSASGAPIAAAADNVPVLIRLHTGNFQFLDAKPDGSDLRFIAADDKTPLKFHIEKYDGVNELALVWVQLPKVLPGRKDDFIWLYYGNASAPPAGDAKTSYDAALGLVYHFADSETLPQDSSANANHAARSTAQPSAAGLIGAAALFDGNSEIAIPVTPSLKASGSGFTVSMWVKPAEIGDARLFAQSEGGHSLLLQLRAGKLMAQADELVTAAAGNVAPGSWQHVALVVRDGLTIYLNGQEITHAAGSVAPLGGQVVVGAGLKGEIDELQVSSVARPADWLLLAALGQGPETKFASVAPAEGGEEGGTSYLRILLSAVTPDGWVVIALLMVMFVISAWVMVTKAMFVNRVAKDNGRFMVNFQALVNSIKADEPGNEAEGAARYPNSQLARLYVAGVGELRQRFTAYRAAGRSMELSEQSLDAIRATVEARLVRESQRLNSSMVLLTIAIAGGPFLGLLGTVVGVMITFAAIAAAGDVNVNAIAPGIAAALVATVAGLAVAIPALFGYNYLTGRIQALMSDMQVFVDELAARFAENHSA